MIGVLLILKWVEKNKELIEKCNKLVGHLDEIQYNINKVSYDLDFNKDNIQNFKVPEYDIDTAIDVLGFGTFERLPKAIHDDERIFGTKMDDETIEKEISHLLHLKLLCHSKTSGEDFSFSKITVANGKVSFLVEKEFEFVLTIKNADKDSKWSLEDLKILLGAHLKPPLKFLDVRQLLEIKDYLDKIIQQNDQPIPILHHYLHKFCSDLQLHFFASTAENLLASNFGYNDLPAKIVLLNNKLEENKLEFSYWNDTPHPYKLNLSFDGKFLVRNHFPPIPSSQISSIISPIEMDLKDIVKKKKSLIFQTVIFF